MMPLELSKRHLRNCSGVTGEGSYVLPGADAIGFSKFSTATTPWGYLSEGDGHPQRQRRVGRSPNN